MAAAGWALCAHDAADQQACPATEQEPNDLTQGGMSRARRSQIGMLCKRLIDAGRAAWLREQGLHAEYVTYIDASVTGENRMLLARPMYTGT